MALPPLDGATTTAQPKGGSESCQNDSPPEPRGAINVAPGWSKICGAQTSLAVALPGVGPGLPRETRRSKTFQGVSKKINATSRLSASKDVNAGERAFLD